MGIWKKALVTVPAIVVVGSLMGIVSNSGFENGWYAALDKPAFQPPGWAFGVVWTTLYTMLGIAVAAILDEPPSPLRRTALTLFFVQLAINFAWSPIFFGARMIDVALVTILVMLLLATALYYETGKLNPGADAAPLGITGGQ